MLKCSAKSIFTSHGSGTLLCIVECRFTEAWQFSVSATCVSSASDEMFVCTGGSDISKCWSCPPWMPCRLGPWIEKSTVSSSVSVGPFVTDLEHPLLKLLWNPETLQKKLLLCMFLSNPLTASWAMFTVGLLCFVFPLAFYKYAQGCSPVLVNILSRGASMRNAFTDLHLIWSLYGSYVGVCTTCTVYIKQRSDVSTIARK